VNIRFAAAPQQHQGERGEGAEGEGEQPASKSAPEPSSRECWDASGQFLLGAIPETARKRLAALGEALQGSVRSIKRDEAGRPVLLLVRVQTMNGLPVTVQGEWVVYLPVYCSARVQAPQCA
jgi:hypothetical protein